MLGCRTPLSRDRSDCLVPVSSITSRSTSLRLVMEQPSHDVLWSEDRDLGFARPRSGTVSRVCPVSDPLLTNDTRRPATAQYPL